MKIALLTTLPGLIENKRIEDEVQSLGHSFTLINLQNFNFFINQNKLSIPELDNIDADILIVRGIFNSIKPITTVIKNLRKNRIKIFDNNFLTHQYVINKVNDQIKLSLRKVSTPNTYYARDFSTYHNTAKKIGYPVIVKSTRMGKGVGVHKLDNPSELKNIITQLQGEGKSAKGYLMQEFIPYIHDLRILIIGEHAFTMKRIPKEGEFRANFSLGGSVENFDLDDDTKKLAIKALKTIGMSVGGVDVLITSEGKKYILEVNHVAGMVGMELAVSQNITKTYVEHALQHAK